MSERFYPRVSHFFYDRKIFENIWFNGKCMLRSGVGGMHRGVS